MINPFDLRGIVRDAQDIARYQDLPDSLVEVLRHRTDRTPEMEAIVEIGGRRINYRQLWDEAARVAGGLKAQGIARGDRVAIQLGNGLNWCLAFFGTLMSGAVV